MSNMPMLNQNCDASSQFCRGNIIFALRTNHPVYVFNAKTIERSGFKEPMVVFLIILYTATHTLKGLDETISAVPLGLVLCLLTLTSGSLRIAVMVHLVMASTNSFTTLKHHPDIHYKSV